MQRDVLMVDLLWWQALLHRPLLLHLEHAAASQSVRSELECVNLWGLACLLPRGRVENFLIELHVDSLLEALLRGSPVCDQLLRVDHRL